MGVLGAVSVTTATVVKAVAIAGVAIGALMLGFDALGWMIPDGALGFPAPDATLKDAMLHSIPFIGGLAGFTFADWIDGKAHQIESKQRQNAQLRRLESHHGVAL